MMDQQTSVTYVSLSVLWQQLMDTVCKQAGVSLGILTDALNQLRVLHGHIVQVHLQRHLLPVGQSHLYTDGDISTGLTKLQNRVQ